MGTARGLLLAFAGGHKPALPNPFIETPKSRGISYTLFTAPIMLENSAIVSTACTRQSDRGFVRDVYVRPPPLEKPESNCNLLVFAFAHLRGRWAPIRWQRELPKYRPFDCAAFQSRPLSSNPHPEPTTLVSTTWPRALPT